MEPTLPLLHWLWSLGCQISRVGTHYYQRPLQPHPQLHRNLGTLTSGPLGTGDHVYLCLQACPPEASAFGATSAVWGGRKVGLLTPDHLYNLA